MSNSEILFASLFGWFLMLGLPLIIALIIIKHLRKRDIKRQARFEIEVEKEKERLLNNDTYNTDDVSNSTSLFNLTIIPVSIIVVILLLFLFFLFVALFNIL